jgi:hypothetical protein
MTASELNKLSPTAAIGHVVTQPRDRSMSWNVAGKYSQTGKQKGPI